MAFSEAAKNGPPKPLQSLLCCRHEKVSILTSFVIILSSQVLQHTNFYQAIWSSLSRQLSDQQSLLSLANDCLFKSQHMRNDDGKTFSVPHWCYGIIITLLYASHASQLSISFQKSRNKSGQNDFQSLKISSENSSLEKV